MGARLMAIVAEGAQNRVYLAPITEHEAIAKVQKPEWKPVGNVPAKLTGGTCVPYGMKEWGDLFTPRQLVALTTFGDLVSEAREKIQRDALVVGIADDGKGIDVGGTGAKAYADAVSIYLGLALSRLTDICNSLCRWENTRTQVRNLFSRQAIPMLWDFAENNVFAEAAGDYRISLTNLIKALDRMPAKGTGFVFQSDAQTQNISLNKIVSLDPPYYDNIGYADLSDFFYVWLRKTLKSVLPSLFATMAVPKTEELVATPYRHGNKEKAERFFLDGMKKGSRSPPCP